MNGHLTFFDDILLYTGAVIAGLGLVRYMVRSRREAWLSLLLGGIQVLLAVALSPMLIFGSLTYLITKPGRYVPFSGAAEKSLAIRYPHAEVLADLPLNGVNVAWLQFPDGSRKLVGILGVTDVVHSLKWVSSDLSWEHGNAYYTHRIDACWLLSDARACAELQHRERYGSLFWRKTGPDRVVLNFFAHPVALSGFARALPRPGTSSSPGR
ncbi:hypothetical protein [Thiomonas sp.]